MASKALNITLPEELIKKIDKAAKSEYSSRSDFIRDSIVRKLRALSLDEWDDPADLYTDTIDLRNTHGQGMSTQDFKKVALRVLKNK